MDCTNDAYTVQLDFVHACKLANTPPTRRQASRFRMGKGRAFKVSRIVPQAPPVPSWFEPNMGSDTKPDKIKFDLLPPGPDETQEENSAAEEKALELMQQIETRNREISEWKTRFHNRAVEQWPKAWAFRSLGIQ